MQKKVKIPLWAATLVLCASVVTTHVHAQDQTVCHRLNEAAGGVEGNFRPPATATVVGSGRAYFYSAPVATCAMKQTFIVPGDTVIVYKPYKHWYQVMYVDKAGQDFEGWLEEKRLHLTGQLGNDQ